MTTTVPGQGIEVRAELLPVREQITYRRLRQYKYQLMAPYRFATGLRLPRAVGTRDEWVVLSAEGELTFRRGYAWDGPSGPTLDTRNFMRGSLVHDGLYQLMREGLIGREYRKTADLLLRRVCCEDGMSRVRGFLVYWGVRLFAGWAARRRRVRGVLRAP